MVAWRQEFAMHGALCKQQRTAISTQEAKDKGLRQNLTFYDTCREEENEATFLATFSTMHPCELRKDNVRVCQ